MAAKPEAGPPTPVVREDLPSQRTGASLCKPTAACVLLAPVRAGEGATGEQAARADAAVTGVLRSIVEGRVERYDDARLKATPVRRPLREEDCEGGDCLRGLGRGMGFPFVAWSELTFTKVGWGLTFYVSSTADRDAIHGGLILAPDVGDLADPQWLRPHLWAQAAGGHGLPIRRDPTAPPAPPMQWVRSQPAGASFARTETTVAQYRACVEAGVCAARFQSEDCNWLRSDREDHPVNCVSAEDATAFCGWVGGRLPTDSEWFAEASDGGRRRFPWGGDPAKPEDDSLMDCTRAVWTGSSASGRCGHGSTSRVCSMPQGESVSGLCDMVGNVWEWTSPGTGDQARERGGSWTQERPLPADLASADDQRRYVSWGELGFRCARP